ncbi:terminal deoxynucleotidyl transferas-like protein [Boeremia exigua]|uniref:terminal deoxynucleotidyl transferase-like protein n=1 Tax=Boeremia exigua TaxID=749465 RepID=UPI001E8ECF3C|nr:terminal deoxynucleotidyl transferase-like protein [Boeremia exigua]KAH6625674.1 terminal deoxynucleotidyl transferas-like protein [Boeremia exigua]
MDESEHAQTKDNGSLSPVSTISDLGLDLSSLPPVAILSAHLKDDEEKHLKETLRQFHAPLTADVSRARIFIGKVGTKKRAEFELRSRKFTVEEYVTPKRSVGPTKSSGHARKKRKVSGGQLSLDGMNENDSTTEDESFHGGPDEDREAPDEETEGLGLDSASAQVVSLFEQSLKEDLVWVIRLDWLDECVQTGHLQPLRDKLVYTGRVRDSPSSANPRPRIPLPSHKPDVTPVAQIHVAIHPQGEGDILERAKADAATYPPKPQYQAHRTGPSHGSRRFEGKSYAPTLELKTSKSAATTAHLLQQTTSEYEGDDSDIPQPPKWVVKGVKYACQRFTPADGPNEDFLEQLKKIRTARTLIDDEIGVRAYSTIIASIAAYPHRLSLPRELARLPGCDEKTAMLFVEWKNTGKIKAVEDYENDEVMRVLRSFYDIWGVGAKTARNFYYKNSWNELDDIIEFGWNDLDRVQQIGIKYYDEFLDPIPRTEVEEIAEIVHQHAVKLRDDRITVTIVGGYRRGKQASGDVDMIVSHPDLDATAGLIREIVDSLETDEWITHTLIMSLANTDRGQQALPFRSTKARGAGFDTLDKALVVWQDPVWATREQDLEANSNAKNPNVHRRVDIIVAPWRTVGCAVMGWSGGTTFQRDLRRYAKAAKGWKFDSSGVRSRSNGEVVSLEGENGVDGTPEDAEKKVFEGLGLEYIPPEYRVTY